MLILSALGLQRWTQRERKSLVEDEDEGCILFAGLETFFLLQSNEIFYKVSLFCNEIEPENVV